MERRFRTLAIGLGFALMLAACASGEDGVTIDEPEDSMTQQERFVGLELDDAVDLAESEQRLWRISREDGEEFALTADLRPGRVTFEVDNGIVTIAQIERANVDPPRGSTIPEDPGRAQLIADALLRLTTIDNSFNSEDPFDDLRVSRTLRSDGSALRPLDLEMISSALQPLGTVQFIDDPTAEERTLFDNTPTGVAVLAVQRVDILDDRAEIELTLWCGSLCGVYLTYEAVPADDGWEIVGTVGPIAVS